MSGAAICGHRRVLRGGAGAPFSVETWSVLCGLCVQGLGLPRAVSILGAERSAAKVFDVELFVRCSSSLVLVTTSWRCKLD